MCVYMCVCVYVCVCVCVCVCVSVPIAFKSCHIIVDLCVCCVYVCNFAIYNTHTSHTYLQIAYIHSLTHVRTRAHTRTYTHTYTHTIQGMDLHPNFVSNGLFYVHYSCKKGTTHHAYAIHTSHITHITQHTSHTQTHTHTQHSTIRQTHIHTRIHTRAETNECEYLKHSHTHTFSS